MHINQTPLRCLQPLSRPNAQLSYCQLRYLRTRARNPKTFVNGEVKEAVKKSSMSNRMKAALKKIDMSGPTFKVGSIVASPFEKGYKVRGYEKAKKEAAEAAMEAYKEAAGQEAERKLREYEEEQKRRKERYEQSTEHIRTGTVFKGPPPDQPSKPKVKFREAPKEGLDTEGDAYRAMQEEHLRLNPDWDGDEDELRRKSDEQFGWNKEDKETEKLFGNWKNPDGSINMVTALKDTVKQGFREARGPSKELQALVQNLNRKEPDYYKAYHLEDGRVNFHRIVEECRHEMREEELEKFRNKDHSKEAPDSLEVIKVSAKAGEVREASE